MYSIHRHKKNPIISPDPKSSFESFATFNGSPIETKSSISMLYRAQSKPEKFEDTYFSMSVVAKAESRDGINFKSHKKFIFPENPWERFGCEDPRITKIDDKYFIFYTALSAFPLNIPGGIKVGLAISSDLEEIEEKHLITPFNAKAMTLFPEKINGKYVALLTVNPDILPTHICLAEFKKLEDMWDPSFWNTWYQTLSDHIFIPGDSEDRIEIGSTPIKTEKGWLIVTCRIQHHAAPNRVFGIEAMLLDLNDPKKIIGKTHGPLLVPEEKYEKEGILPNIIFPSGALVQKDMLYVYYGATDTTLALATVNLTSLLEAMELPHKETGFIHVTKKEIIAPMQGKGWEEKAVFNPAAIDLEGKVRILYRAMSNDNTSTVGYAESENGRDISYIDDKPIYVPKESFEEKRVPGGNSGCEDPRLTQIGEIIYMYYTAYNGVTPPAIAMTSIKKKDFLAKKWNWSKPVLVSKDNVDDKDGCLHPEKVNGKYFLFHRVDNKICGDFGKTPSFTERNNFKDIPILSPRAGMWDSKKVGISVPPIKTKKGWLLLYHGVSDNSVYRVGACLLDLKDPTVVLSRASDSIFEPTLSYEKNGQVNSVVFPCGAIVRDDTIYMYYGGGDSVVGVATLSLNKLLESLKK